MAARGLNPRSHMSRNRFSPEHLSPRAMWLVKLQLGDMKRTLICIDEIHEFHEAESPVL